MQANVFFNTVLQKLVDKHDKGTVARISANEKSLVEYQDNPTPGFSLKFENIVSDYEREGLIKVIRYKNSAGIKSILLTDYELATTLLGHKPLSEKITDALALLSVELKDVEFFEQILDRAEYQWSKDVGYFGCSVLEPEKLIEIIRSGVAVLNRKSEPQTIDYRHFSATYLSHSKRLYDIKGKVVEFLKQFDSEKLEGLSVDEVLAFYGVVQLNHPVYISGEISLLSDTKELDASFGGGVGIWPKFVTSVKPINPVRTLTTIENQATYEKYIQTSHPDEVVLFTSGIPSPGFKFLYKKILKSCKPVIVQHWSDIDIGGFTILRMLESAAGQSIKAFNMNPEQYSKEYAHFSEKELGLLRNFKFSGMNQAIIEKAILVGKKYEQEAFAWNRL